MTKESDLSNRKMETKTNRRSFLTKGAAAAGVALLGPMMLGATGKLPMAIAQEPQDGEEICQALFVQDAKGVELKKDSIILKEPNDHLIFFCDRPVREAGFLTWDAFMDSVTSGENSFAQNPPNASLTIVDNEGQIHELILFLMGEPIKAENKITFPVEYIIGGPYPIDGKVVMFIDPIGRPLSPVSVAGVHRRRRRRHIRN
jgi:hypothetical protein